MAKPRYLVTRVYNQTGADLPVGFLGDNGATITSGSYYDHPGVLIDSLNAKERAAYEAMLAAGQIDVVEIPNAVTDGISSPLVVMRGSFGTGRGTSAIYNAALPAKTRIIDGFVVITSPGNGPYATARDTQIQVTNGTTGILKQISIAATAAGDTDIVRFVEVDDAKYALNTGSSLIIAVTGTTGMPAGDVYVYGLIIE
jgi:hypothetical protein